jgi:hypothetical protein
MNQTTHVAVLGTLAEFHPSAIPYDMQALVDLVVDVHPDLLCLDMSPEQWRRGDFGDLPPEYREALLPLAGQSNIVVVPVGGDGAEETALTGWQGRLVGWLRTRLAALQQTAPGLDAINRGWRHDLGNLIYHLIAGLSPGEGQQRRAEHLATLRDRVVQAARRDPGARMLVVVNIQYCHLLRPELQKYPDIDVVSYHEL